MRIFTAAALLLLAAGALAQGTYRWVDKDGKVHYSDRPPAPSEAKSVEQRRAGMIGMEARSESWQMRTAKADYPVTLYTQPDCGEACKAGRDHLNRRGIPFAEKSVASAEDIAAMKAAGGEGELVIPVVQVGSRAIRGHKPAEWDSLFDAAGYPKEETKAKR